MPDVGKVIKGFECCHVMVHDLGPDKTSCGICAYKDVQTEEQIDLGGVECIAVLHDDALELVKRQQETIASLQCTIRKLSASLGEQPEQKHGAWLTINHPVLGMKSLCSVCELLANEDYRFCPHCGAKMDD